MDHLYKRVIEMLLKRLYPELSSDKVRESIFQYFLDEAQKEIKAGE